MQTGSQGGGLVLRYRPNTRRGQARIQGGQGDCPVLDPPDIVPTMSEAAVPNRHRRDGARPGQSFVEFALVLPLLLVLLLGVADFGRVFSAGIAMEASARNAAELAAIERLRNEPDTAGDVIYYAALHDLAADSACAESRRLPTFDATDACPDGAHDGGGAPSWFVRVCVHDGADPICDTTPTGYSVPPSGMCDEYERPISNAVPNAIASYFVEVRLCYKFETLLNLNLALPMNAGLGVGDIWLERTRTFVIDCPVGVNPTDLAVNCPNP